MGRRTRPKQDCMGQVGDSVSTKKNGGLGIKDINNFNLALLGKWRWNLMQHKGELWARVVESKYEGWRGLFEADRVGPESVWWRDLKRALVHTQ